VLPRSLPVWTTAAWAETSTCPLTTDRSTRPVQPPPQGRCEITETDHRKGGCTRARRRFRSNCGPRLCPGSETRTPGSAPEGATTVGERRRGRRSSGGGGANRDDLVRELETLRRGPTPWRCRSSRSPTSGSERVRVHGSSDGGGDRVRVSTTTSPIQICRMKRIRVRHRQGRLTLGRTWTSWPGLRACSVHVFVERAAL
jgi:hypothetical protein